MRREGEGAGGWRCRSLKAPSPPGIPRDLSCPPSPAQPPRGWFPKKNPQKRAAPQPRYLCCSINTLQAAVCSRTAHGWGCRKGDAKGDPQCPPDVPPMSPAWFHSRTSWSNFPQFLQHQHPIFPAIPRARTRSRSCRGSEFAPRPPWQRCPGRSERWGCSSQGREGSGQGC